MYVTPPSGKTLKKRYKMHACSLPIKLGSAIIKIDSGGFDELFPPKEALSSTHACMHVAHLQGNRSPLRSRHLFSGFFEAHPTPLALGATQRSWTHVIVEGLRTQTAKSRVVRVVP